MGVRTLLTAVKDRVSDNSFEVWEETDGSVQAYQNGAPLSQANLGTDGIGITSLSASGFEFVNRPAFRKTGLFKKRSTTLDDMTGANAAWALFSGTGTKSDSTTFIKQELGCENALKINATSSLYRIRRVIPSTTLSGVINFWFYLSEDPVLSANITIRFSSDTFSTSSSSTFSRAHGFRKGWNCISWHVSEDGTTTSSGTVPSIAAGWPASQTGIQLEFGNFEQPSVPTGIAPTIYVGGAFFAGEGVPSIMLNWDDSVTEQWAIFNIFRRYNLRGSISVIPTNIDAGGLTMAQLREIYDSGWDVVNHTMHSTTGNLASDSAAVATAKISQARDWMISNGFTRTANVLVWPENAYTSTIAGVDMIAIAQSLGMTVTRGSQRRDMAVAQGLDNPLRLASTDFGGKTLAQALKILDAAELYKQLNIIYGHKITGTDTVPASGGAAPGDTLQWYRSDYLAFAANLADRVTAGTLQVITYSDLLDKFRV